MTTPTPKKWFVLEVSDPLTPNDWVKGTQKHTEESAEKQKLFIQRISECNVRIREHSQ